MDRFQLAVDRVFKLEGGYINHPDDRGGPTNMGITMATLSAHRGEPVTIDDIKNLSKAEATAIYKIRYWDKMGLERCDTDEMAIALFDQGVLRGTSTVIRALQTILKVTADGAFGPKTEVALKSFGEDNALREFIQSSQIAYAEICVKNPSQLVFLKGWLNRTHALWDDLLSMMYLPMPDESKPQGGLDMSVESETPWMNWMLSREGWKESDPTQNRELAKGWHYVGLNFKDISGRSHAWCAMVMNSALIETGFKGNGSAAAVSFETYGTPCEYKYGAIIPIRHKDGSHHVTFFNRWIDKNAKIAECLGGNQSDALRRSAYNMSGNKNGHDECVSGPRWPIKA